MKNIDINKEMLKENKKTKSVVSSIGAVTEEIKSLPLDALIDFKDHPFKVKDDDAMAELVASIKDNGVLKPGTCRPKGEGKFEVIEGHRRKRACEMLGINTMPFVVKELDDDEAALLMIDSNLYRPYISPSEKAFAYKKRLDALKHQGKGGEGRSDQVVADATGDSRSTVQRYIRLTHLNSHLLDLVDNGRLPLGVGEEVSYLNKGSQKALSSVLKGDEKLKVSLDQAKSLRGSEDFLKKLTEEDVIELIVPVKDETEKWSFKEKDVDGFFPEHFTPSQKKAKILDAISYYVEQHSPGDPTKAW